MTSVTLDLTNMVRSSYHLSWSFDIAVNIGRAAKTSGVSAKMIRYYESIGLFPQADRTAGGYRDYDDADVQRLRFIRRARGLGFSLDRIGELLTLWSDQDRHSADVKTLALAHIDELEGRAAELRGMIRTLRTLVRACDGDDRPDCPIMEELGASQTPIGRRTR
jgi:MerR family transcriptional regulator, copper efflux regulator